MTGSGIFDGENDSEESGSANSILTNRTGIRMYQVFINFFLIEYYIHGSLHLEFDIMGWICQQAISGMSHISFGEDESISPKKPTTVPEVAKQRELSGTLDSESETTLKKQFSNAKCKELSGHDIFAPPPEILPQPVTARILDLKGSIEIGEPALHNVGTFVKVSSVIELHGCTSYIYIYIHTQRHPKTCACIRMHACIYVCRCVFSHSLVGTVQSGGERL